MRYLIVPIEAGAEKCEDCEHLSVLGNYCNLYEECFNSPELAEHQLRLPAGLAAEKRKESVKKFLDWMGLSWKEAREDGYRVRRVEISWSEEDK